MALAIKRVLVSDPVDPSCVDLLARHGIDVTCKYKLPKEELIAIIPEYDGLVVRSETKVSADVLEAGVKLKVVGRAGTGVDNIDCKAATQKGVIVLNTPGGNSISACELTCSLITASARNIAAGCQSLKEGRWDRKLYTGSELSGKTLAVLGLGRIGREVALRMQAYGMKTIGFDPMVSKEQAKLFNVDKMELEEIWPQADYITVHTPLIPQTRNLINTETLKKCKKGVRVVNVARGGIVDEAALLQSLKEGHCGGAALDVFTEEPPKSPGLLELIKHPRVIATPHLGASTEEAQVRVAVEIAEQFVALAFPDSGYPLTGIVNAPALLALRDPANLPWIDLSRGLGGLAGKLAANEPFPNLKVHIETEGDELKGKGFLITPALMGMLKGRRKNGLNLINTPSLASEAGLQGEITHHGGEPALSVVVASSSFKHRLRGVARGSDTLLMSIDDANFVNGVPLDTNTLLFCSQNPQTDTSAIIAELVKKGAVIRNLAIASGKSAWISIQADNLPEVSQIPNVRAFL